MPNVAFKILKKKGAGQGGVASLASAYRLRRVSGRANDTIYFHTKEPQPAKMPNVACWHVAFGSP